MWRRLLKYQNGKFREEPDIRTEMGYDQNWTDPLKKEIFYETTYIHPQNGQMMRKKTRRRFIVEFWSTRCSPYQRIGAFIRDHVDAEDKQNCQNDSFESPRGMTVINESGLYSSKPDFRL